MTSLILIVVGTVYIVHLLTVTIILNNHTNKLRSAVINKDWKEADKLLANAPTSFYGHKDMRTQPWLDMNKRAGWNE